MQVKMILRNVAVILFACLLSVPASVAMAATPPTLTATANGGGNYVHLNWSEVGDKSQPWNYQIEQIKAGSSVPQTIPAKSTVKVLNVYPSMWGSRTNNLTFTTPDNVTYHLPMSADLKMWMECANLESPNGYGKGLIHVDPVFIGDFNANPNAYLKNSDGSWKYDVVYFGSWDGYGSGDNTDDLTGTSEKVMEQFIQSGRGVLLGHDTATLYFDHPNFTQFAEKYANIQVSNKIPTYGDTQATIEKKGLLTNYPWTIGNVGQTLTIPMAHTYGQFTTTGDVWLQFNNNIWLGGSGEKKGEISSYDGKTGTNNFYLMTWNNVAMIQTGHSGGKATPDEQKVLANTLFYLSQLTQNTSWDDHSGQDLAAPNAPTVSGVTPGSNSVSLNVGGSTDSGSLYTYDVVATGQNDGTKLKSNSVTTTVTSGLKGYAVSVDQNPNGTPPVSAIKRSDSGSVTMPIPSGNYYVHTAAFDNENNESPAVTKLVDRTNPALSVLGNPATTVHNAVTLQAAASDNEACASGVKQVETPDGVWHSGASASYTVANNGSYTFKAQDKAGNVTQKMVNVTNIGDKLWVSNPPTVSTSASTRDGSGPLLFSGPKFSIEDNRGTKSGWQVMAQATPLTDGRHALPEGSLLIKAPAISGPTAGPKVPFSGYQAIDRSNSVTIASAAKGYGDGRYTIDSSASDGLKALVPARAYTGTYRSTVTTSLVEAP